MRVSVGGGIVAARGARSHPALPNCTDAGSPDASARLTVKIRLLVPVSPSSTEPPVMLTSGAASSLRIVPVPVPSRIVAIVGSERMTVSASSTSCVVSPATPIVMLLLVSPGAKVSGGVRDADKSLPTFAGAISARAVGR